MKPYLMKTFFSRQLAPARIFVFSFAAFIILGTLALWLPFSANSENLRFVDALFSSTSAVCVTGLASIDIGRDLSFVGQVVTMILFQVGGFGIITFSIVLFILMGRSISFKGREITQTAFLHTPKSDFYLIIKKVLLYTIIIESVGSLFLFSRFVQEFPAGQAFYFAVYHAISAFNNCGYSLFSGSLSAYQSDIIINVTMMSLIIIGGIGFIVQQEIVAKLRGKEKKFSLHTKVVLVTTVVLIFAGAVSFYLTEMNNVLRGATPQAALLSSFFQSVVPRTAGFSTVDMRSLTNSTILIIMILMFIGASPGSTGGGVKTTSFAILCILIFNRFKSNQNVNVANRTVPTELVDRTISIVLMSAVFIGAIAAMLLFFENSGLEPLYSRYQFIEYVFETFSAFGNVGLSMGITTKLNDVQKYIIIVTMFIGRVGPLALAFSLYSSRKKRITYAEESVMVG
jgi:trk system potassium uptake protein